MPREFPRSRRIAEQIQRILSDVIRADVRDPRLDKAMVSDVDVTRDLSVAWVYVTSFIPDADPEELLAAFRSAAGFLRGRLARELTVRNVPELRFRFDDSLRKGAELDSLIDSAVALDKPGTDDEGQGEPPADRDSPE